MRRLSRKTKLSLTVIVLGLAAIVYAQVTTTTSVGRLELLFPDYRHVDDPPGSLHAKMAAYIEKISDNMNGRYFVETQNEGVKSTFRHNYGVAFSTQCTYLYTGTHPNLTLVSNPAIAGWTIEANPTNPNEEIDVTTPSTPGSYSYAIISTATACGGGGDTVDRIGIAKGPITKYSLLKSEDDGGTAKLSRLATGNYALVDDPSDFQGGSWPTSTYFGEGLRFHYSNTYTSYYSIAGSSQSQFIQGDTDGLTRAASSIAQSAITHGSETNDRARIWPINDTEVCACMVNAASDRVFFSRLSIDSATTFSVTNSSSTFESLPSPADEFTCGYDPTGDQCVAGIAKNDQGFSIVAWDYNTDTIKARVDAATVTTANRVFDFFATPDDGTYGFVVEEAVSLKYVLANKGGGAGPTQIVNEHASSPIACEPVNGNTTTNGGSTFVTACKSGTNMLYVAGSVSSNTVTTSPSWNVYASSKTHMITPQFESFDGSFLLYSYTGNQYYYRALTHDGVNGGTLGAETLLSNANSGGGNFGIGSFATSSPYTSQVLYVYAGDQQLLIGRAIPEFDPSEAAAIALEDATDGANLSYALLGDIANDTDLGATLGPLYIDGNARLSASVSNIPAGNVSEFDKIKIMSKIASSSPKGFSYAKASTYTSSTNDVILSDPLPAGRYLANFGAYRYRITHSASTTERVFVNLAVSSGNVEFLNSQFLQLTCGFQQFDSAAYNYWEHFGYSCTAFLDVSEGSVMRINISITGTSSTVERPYLSLQPIDLKHTTL